MQLLELQIPDGLGTTELAHILEVGHGYRWLSLLKQPRALFYGSPPNGTMPELLIVGPDCMLINTDDPLVIDRFHRMLDLFIRTPQPMREVVK